MLKTQIFMLFSLQRAKAAVSMTLIFCSIAESKVSESYLMADGSCIGSLEYMPSTFVALKTISAPISIALSAAAVSVVKHGLPVPAEKMTTLPFASSFFALE